MLPLQRIHAGLDSRCRASACRYSPKTSPPLAVTLRVAHILNHHYPERLHSLLIVDAPAVFHLLATAVRPFMDSVTMGKVHFASSKKHDPSTGALQSGKHDPSGLADIWDLYKTPYDQDKYVHYLKELESESSSHSMRITSTNADDGSGLPSTSGRPGMEPFTVLGAGAHDEAPVAVSRATSGGSNARFVTAESVGGGIRSASGHSGPLLRGTVSNAARSAVRRMSSFEFRRMPSAGARSSGAHSGDLSAFYTADSADIRCALAAGELREDEDAARR